jgi:hypothetical protein
VSGAYLRPPLLELDLSLIPLDDLVYAAKKDDSF